MPRPFTFMIKNGKAFVVMFRNFVCASGPVLEKCKEDLILPKKKGTTFHIFTLSIMRNFVHSNCCRKLRVEVSGLSEMSRDLG